MMDLADNNDPYDGDEGKYQEHFRKTFITEKDKDENNGDTFSLHDMMIPAGKVCKLIRVPDPTDQDFRISEVMNKLKLNQPTPVINLAGTYTERATKTLAGIARASIRTDAVIVDSGIASGIEKFTLRKKLTLIGVAPENEIIYPRIATTDPKDNEITNGHTHVFLAGETEE